jgi:hypothetical protein
MMTMMCLVSDDDDDHVPRKRGSRWVNASMFWSFLGDTMAAAN